MSEDLTTRADLAEPTRLIFTLKEAAEQIGITPLRLRKLLPKIHGMTVIRFSPRSIAFVPDQIQHVKDWLNPPPFAPPPAEVNPTLQENELPELWRQLYKRAKRGAFVRDISFKLPPDDFMAIVKRANHRCEVTGLPFSHEKPDGHKWKPFAPSLDRRDSMKPYDADNCRLVSCAVNVAMGQWGEDVLWKIAEAMVAKRRAADA